ncbi:MAG: family 20 glycosylhydrolase, partial [Bryobacteraceae bacterium]
MYSRLTFAMLAGAMMLAAAPLPVRGIRLSAPMPGEVQRMTKFIREVLVREGVNTLVLEINYRYQFQRHPEVADADALSLEDARAIAAAAREAGIELIPLVNLLGHQSWAKKTFGLLKAHPEFDETPELYKDNEGIYCRSYCLLHPRVHEVVFDVIDEILEAFQADALHAGMDEVFLIGEESCARCKGKDKAQLFAGEVRAIHDHLAARGRRLWIWSDRLIDGNTTGIGEWEASQNGTAAA